jgi:hypothetical protein
MAVVTTTVNPVPRVTPFTGISEVEREKSGIARAEVIYSAFGLWAAPGSGNSRGLIFSWDLDPDYGHVLMDCSALVLLSTGESVTMEASAWMEIYQTLPTDSERQYYQLVSHPSRQQPAGTTPIGDIPAYTYNTLYPSGTDVGSMAFTMETKPTALLYPFPGKSSISCSTVFGESYLNGYQYAYRYYARFLQYDVAQGYNYVIQSPSLIR